VHIRASKIVEEEKASDIKVSKKAKEFVRAGSEIYHGNLPTAAETEQH